MKHVPKLRTVQKYVPPFPINSFPKGFAVGLGREIVYHLATRAGASLEGKDWERIFAEIIGARWKPSVVGLDDVVLEQSAWGAKTVISNNPATTKRVRLISGRNSPTYSYGDSKVTDVDADELGAKVLRIWNDRVAGIRKHYKDLRTVVLLKAEDLLELAVFESETVMYVEQRYRWNWNPRTNLEGFDVDSGEHKFTWQPSGSQFTILEHVPTDRLAIRIRQPPRIPFEDVMNAIHFDESWIEIIS